MLHQIKLKISQQAELILNIDIYKHIEMQTQLLLNLLARS